MGLTYSQNWDGASIVGWTLGAGLARAANGYSSPNSLDLASAGTGKVFATFNTQDDSDGNLELHVKVKFTAANTSTGTWVAGVAARGSATPLNDSSTSFYWACVEFRPKLGFFRLIIRKTVNGVTTDLVGQQITDLAEQAWYDVVLRIHGQGPVTLSAGLQRISDGKWLGTDQDWHADQIMPAQASDSSSPIAGIGFSGVVYQSSSGGQIRTDDFDISPFVTVQDSLTLTPSPDLSREKIASAAATINLAASPSARRELAKSVTQTFNLQAVASPVANQFSVSVEDTFDLEPEAEGPAEKTGRVTVPISLSTATTEVRERPAAVSTGIALAAALSEISEHAVGVESTIDFADPSFGGVDVAEFPAGVVESIGFVAAPAATKQTDTASVTDTIRFSDLASRTASPVSVDIADTIRFLDSASFGGAVRTYDASVADSIHFSGSPAEFLQFIREVAVTETLKLAGVISHGVQGEWNVSVENTLTLSSPPSSGGSFLITVGITDAMLFRSTVSSVGNRLFSVATTDTLRIFVQSPIIRDLNAAVSDTFRLSASVLEAGQTIREVAETLTFSDVVRAGREISVGVLESLALSTPPEPPVGLHSAQADTSINFSAFPDAIPGVKGAVSPDTLHFSTSVSSTVESLGSSFYLPLLANVDTEWPATFAESPEGDVVMANGVDRMAVIKSLPGYAEWIGVEPPSSRPLLGGTDVGVITGRRAAFVRFIDSDGNPSALSPISNVVDFGWERPIDDLLIGSSGAMAITVPDHGLVTGDTVVTRDIGGIPQANASLLVVRLDQDTLGLNNVQAASGQQWHGGGSIVYGVKTVVYSQVPVPSEPKVARRQVLRNLEGNANVFYVDIDTADLTSTTLTSERLDDSLRLQEPVVIQGEDGQSYESRYALPPSNKPIIASYAGRLWAAGEVAYDTGCVLPVQGSATIRGVGTNWKRSLVGRLLYINGAGRAYSIVAVDETNQRITLDEPVAETNLPRYATYVIRSAPIERRVVRYSEPGDYGVWPADNSVAIPEDGGAVVGLVRHGQALCVVCEQRIYRIVARANPQEDASLFLNAYRGAVNHRCIVEADGYLFCLDDQGVHRYDGSESAVPISDDVQCLFRTDGISDFPQIDWASTDRRLWHGCLDPTRTTLRWFVDFQGKEPLTHALCYNHRSQSWWLEQYPYRVASSGTGDLSGRKAVAGVDLRRIVCLGQGQTDLAAPGDGTLQGTATSGSSLGLSDATAAFPDSLAGTPFAITGGPGKGQSGVIVGNTATAIEWRDELDPAPAEGSTYQIGGIAWEWRSGWMDTAEEESDTDRSVTLAYQPQAADCCIDVRLHHDHSDEPETWGYATDADGVQSEVDGPDMRFSLQANQAGQGFRLARLAAHAAKNAYGGERVQLRMSGVQGPEQTRIYRIDMSGAEFLKEE